MTQPRILVPQSRWSQLVQLDSRQIHRLRHVLRLGPGDEIEVFDGEGSVCKAILVEEKQGWFLKMGPGIRKPQHFSRVKLGLALLKGKKLDLVIRMVTEIGVMVIEPILCSRSISRPDGENLESKLQRWQAIVEEASRQSGRSTSPVVCAPKTFEEALQGKKSPIRAILHEAANRKKIFELFAAPSAGESFLLVGPEGGFSPREVQLAESAGFEAVQLGLPILRAETAAVVAAAFACLDRSSTVE